VPVLVDGDLAVWDTLAIAEYLAEKFADKQLWPHGRKAARAGPAASAPKCTPALVRCAAPAR
jgi:glutathione S-transferase